MKRGKLICIEGIDAAGKTTQTRMLQLYLMKKYPDRIINEMAFPQYGSESGKLIQQYLDGKLELNQFALNNLYSMNRYEYKEILEDLLGHGCVLILNRYTLSNIAYGAFNGDTAARIEVLDQYLPEPDLVIILDMNPRISQARNQNQDRNERDLEYLYKVRDNYIGLVAEDKWNDKYNIQLVYANQPKEQVHKRIVEIVEESGILAN